MLNVSFYRFCPLKDLATLRPSVKERAAAAGLKGTVILSPEGINGFLAVVDGELRGFLDWLRETPSFQGLEAKESYSESQPFGKLLVKLKQEIIPFGEGIDPHRGTAPRLSALELKRWLDEGRDVVLLDTRNDYEVADGPFRGAKTLGLNHFRDFPRAFGNASRALRAEMAAKPVVMFCTGGIRCEKAAAYAQELGLPQVYQLDGGILKYFEEAGGAHYDGTCFVFDERRAVDALLAPALQDR